VIGQGGESVGRTLLTWGQTVVKAVKQCLLAQQRGRHLAAEETAAMRVNTVVIGQEEVNVKRTRDICCKTAAGAVKE